MDDPMEAARLSPRHLARRWWLPLGRTYKILFLVAAVFYTAVVAGVLSTSPLVQLDWYVVMLKPYEQWPHLHGPLNVFVIAGQRGPAALAALAWLGWCAWRNRTWRPLLVLLVALALLNVSVGAVKLGTGRLGPHYADTVGSAELFRGGLIFPSGHTANGVVTWGTVAYLATRHRRTAAMAAGIAAFTIGLTTIYLGTHWVSDVLGGWAAGVLVLLVLPLFEPLVGIMDERIVALWRSCHIAPVLLRAASLASAESTLDVRRPLDGVPGGRQHRIIVALPKWCSHGVAVGRVCIAARAPPRSWLQLCVSPGGPTGEGPQARHPYLRLWALAP
jgi:membrane-associated phospholipid phosphatase